jgi:hypothetical protein
MYSRRSEICRAAVAAVAAGCAEGENVSHMREWTRELARSAQKAESVSVEAESVSVEAVSECRGTDVSRSAQKAESVSVEAVSECRGTDVSRSVQKAESVTVEAESVSVEAQKAESVSVETQKAESVSVEADLQKLTFLFFFIILSSYPTKTITQTAKVYQNRMSCNRCHNRY